jgi:hypothetical protein
MTNNAAPHDGPDDKPLDPAVEAVRQRLARLLMVSIGIMMIGLLAVLGAIVYRINDRAPLVQADAQISLPQGALIVGEALDGERILLRLRNADGSQSIVIHSTADGGRIARFAIAVSPGD